MTGLRFPRLFGAGVLTLALAGSAASAQNWGQDNNRPPEDVPYQEGGQGDNEGALSLRISKLENALRRATGQIEDLQNENRKLSQQLQKFREDVEYRLSGKTGAAPTPEPTVVANAPGPQALPRPRRTDAFDPDANPNAPGAPRPMGTTAPSAPLTLSSHAPDAPAPPKLLPTPLPTPKQAPAEEPPFVASSVPFSDSKEQFNAAIAAYKAGQYADAEALLKKYIDDNKGTAGVADAVFYIGETYMQRKRAREAAEQYLKVSTEYPKSRYAPDAMVRLGLALAQLGNNEQACATFVEVGKRYPTARAEVRRAADREIQARRCT